MRVLIIENSPLYSQLLDNIFGELGFERDICYNTEAAYAYLESEAYDLVCINQYWQDKVDIELVKYCDKHLKNEQVPIIFLTSNESDTKDLESQGISEIVLKINPQQISAQITRFVVHHLDSLFNAGRVLLIEDSDSITSVMLGYLKSAGYNVLHFGSGEDAWAAFKAESSYGSVKNAFDLVISDIMLEGEMSGVEVVKNIRSLNDARGCIPIITMTADNTDKLRLNLYQIGVNDFLEKPFLTEELLIRIYNLISNKRLLDKVHDQRRELFVLATTDKLTGCHNRHSLMDFSVDFFSQASQRGYPISLLVLDLDHFKLVNDTHGHSMGDLALEAVGQLLNASFRKDDDLVARFGGEEFVVLMNHCDAVKAKIIAENLRQKIEQLKPGDIEITASIGIASIEIEQNVNFETLFSLADAGVYKAKSSGRNRVVYLPIDPSR
jgi:two-component system cell cycle response regulator